MWCIGQVGRVRNLFKYFKKIQGSTSCLKRHIKTCPHLGKGTSERFADLHQEFDKNWLLELAHLDDTR